MFIKSINVKNFKRFTDLTLDLTSHTDAKLVLLIWANWSGKSSIMDIFQGLKIWNIGRDKYFAKRDISEFNWNIETSDWILFFSHNVFPTNHDLTKRFFTRSSTRIVSTPERKRYSREDYNLDKYAAIKSILPDERFHYDLEHYITLFNEALRSPAFAWLDNVSIKEIRETYIDKLNDSLERIFWWWETTLSLTNLKDPSQNQPADLIFSKWNTKDISYHLLSHGEKQIIILLLYFLVNQEMLKDSVLFIDEMDNHLHTSLQYSLLEEIVATWLPEWCQLWTASHSLGFIEYAKSYDKSIILDFDSLNFDVPQIITPLIDTNEVFEIAVPKNMLNSLFSDKKIFFCENQDDVIYNWLWFSNYVFAWLADKDVVINRVKSQKDYFWLIDRDFLTDIEKSTIEKAFPTLRILEYYSLESYLYHPDNIAELYPDLDKESYKQDIVQYIQSNHLSLWGKIKWRDTYYVFRNQTGLFTKKEKESGEKVIHENIESNDFETVYPYVPMKDYDKTYLSVQGIQCDPSKLWQTDWMKQKLSEIISDK